VAQKRLLVLLLMSLAAMRGGGADDSLVEYGAHGNDVGEVKRYDAGV